MLSFRYGNRLANSNKGRRTAVLVLGIGSLLVGLAVLDLSGEIAHAADPVIIESSGAVLETASSLILAIPDASTVLLIDVTGAIDSKQLSDQITAIKGYLDDSSGILKNGSVAIGLAPYGKTKAGDLPLTQITAISLKETIGPALDEILLQMSDESERTREAAIESASSMLNENPWSKKWGKEKQSIVDIGQGVKDPDTALAGLIVSSLETYQPILPFGFNVATSTIIDYAVCRKEFAVADHFFVVIGKSLVISASGDSASGNAFYAIDSCNGGGGGGCSCSSDGNACTIDHCVGDERDEHSAQA